MDSRLWEWRHQLEEEVRSKFVEIEQSVQRVTSSMRVLSTTNEDVLKRHGQRVHRVEGMLEEKVQSSEETQSSLMALHERLEQLEQTRLQDLALVPSDATSGRALVESSPLDGAALLTVETRLSDAYSKV